MPPSLLLLALQEVWNVLDLAKFPKAIAGGLALSFWGYPRSTQDIDIAILLSNENDLNSLLLDSGFRPKKSLDAAQLGFVKISQWIYCNTDAYVDIEIDLLIGHSDYHRLALERAVPCTFPDIEQDLKVLTCEDLIIFKAVSGRMIDLADIRALMTYNANSLDRDYLDRVSNELGLRL